MKIGFVIPTYNEKQNISVLLPALFEVIQQNKLEATAIIVDDNSPDGTAKTAEQLSKKYKIVLINRKTKSGLGKAYIAGFQKAMDLDCGLIFSMDADLSHNPKYIPDFIKEINKGCDVVLGSRYVKGGGNNWGAARKIISKGGNSIAKIILGLKANDLTTGYRCYKSEVLKKINLGSITSNGYAFLEEVLFLCHKNNFKICEVPIYFEDRTMGASKLEKKEIAKFLITIFRLKIKDLFGKF